MKSQDEVSDNDDDEVPELVDIDSEKIVPVTILTGFLGSGKTTLLNYILTVEHGKRIAVVENEFSEGLGVETMIAKSGVNGDNISDFFELPNGCICCTIKDNLISTLEQLVIHKDRFDYLIIETTGLANPGPVISAFWTDDGMNSCLHLDGVICVIDSSNILKYLTTEEISDDVRKQICFSDRILINKIDLIDEETLCMVENAVKSVNSLADLKFSTKSRVDLDFILNIDCYSNEDDGSNLINMNSSFMQCIPCSDPENRIEQTKLIPKTVERMMSINSYGNHMISKPLLNDITTIGIKIEGVFQLKELEKLLDSFLYSSFSSKNEENSLKLKHSNFDGRVEVHRMEIYRMKGILHVENDNRLFLMQSVHDIFEIQPSEFLSGSMHDSTNGYNPFVVIGKNLSKTFFEEQLTKCITRVK
eukprot:gene9935-13365_t